MGKWIDSKSPPSDDRRVLIWWLRALDDKSLKSRPGCCFGKYVHSLKEWRPTGCNGDYSSEVTHWKETPNGPNTPKADPAAKQIEQVKKTLKGRIV